MRYWWVFGVAGRLRLHGKRPCRWVPRRRCQFYLRRGPRVYQLTSLWKKGICVVAMWDMCSAVGHLHPPTYQWSYPSMRKKLKPNGPEMQKHLAALESEVFKGLLPLIEHCAVRQYDDGDPREVGWFTVKTNGAAWIIQVKDPDSGCSFSAVADTLDKALETAALLLSCDDAPWEPDQWLQRNGKKKKG